MSHARDLARDLQEWLHEPDRLPPPRVSEVAPLVHRTPQDRGLVLPLLRRFPSMLTATSSFIAAVGLVFIGGILLTELPTQPAVEPSSDPAAVDAAATASPPTVVTSDTQDRGTITSPAGTLVWERFRDTSTPDLGESWSWLGGSVVARARDDDRLFVSPDGVEWNRLTLPDLPAGVRPRALRPAHGGGMAWLVAPAATGREGTQCRRRPDSQSGECRDRPVLAWRTVGDGVWERVEPGTWPRPEPAGFQWEPELRDVVSIGDVTVALEDAKGVFPGALWASDVDCAPRLRQEDDDGYLLVSVEIEAGCPPRNQPVHLQVTEQNDGLVVTDRDSGKAVRIAGADRALLDWLVQEDRYGIGAPERLVVMSAEGISYLPTPWQVDEDAGSALFAADGMFYAYVPGRSSDGSTSATPWGVDAVAEAAPDSSDTVWRSEDGIEWVELDPANAPGLVGATGTQFRADAKAAYVLDDEGVLAASLDGLAFTMRPDSRPDGSRITFTPLGWVAVERYYESYPGRPQVGDAVWLHQAGEWVLLTPLGFDCGVDDDGEPSSVSWAGDTIFISARGCDSPPGDTSSDTWLIRRSDS